MVKELFGVTPHPWQHDVLEAFPHNSRMAMQACRGPGKTALLAWIGWNFMLTRPKPNIAAVSISGDQLRDGLWKELAKWQAKSPLLQSMFQWNTKRIEAKDQNLKANWWMSARAWPKQGTADEQANTLSGLHEDYIMVLMDESGGIPDSVMAVAEAVLSSCKEGHIVQAGNPTHLSGPLYRAATSERDMWYRVEITADPDDPKRANNVSVEWAQAQIRKYGRDHPFVLVNVFGKFPPQSLTALIGPDEVRAAMRRFYRAHEIGPTPKILGIDVARTGGDVSVIAPRQGIQMYKMIRHRNVPDGLVGAGIAARIWDQFDADACFVDATGGLGYTWIDQMKVLGKSAIPVQFSAKAASADRYANKRAEMYFAFVEWIRAGGALPPEDVEGSAEILRALTETNYTFYNDKMILEDKDDIKDKLGFSPDDADACALTFAEPVTPKERGTNVVHRARSAITQGYDAFAEVNRMGTGGGMAHYTVQEYDPYGTN